MKKMITKEKKSKCEVLGVILWRISPWIAYYLVPEAKNQAKKKISTQIENIRLEIVGMKEAVFKTEGDDNKSLFWGMISKKNRALLRKKIHLREIG